MDVAIEGKGPRLSVGDLAPSLRGKRDFLVRANAGLQLLPANATKWIRFERLLALLSAVEPAAEQRSVSRSRLKQLLTTPPIVNEAVISGEDPYEDTFSAAITFHGGSHRILPGGTSGAGAACQLVLEAAQDLPREAPLAEYRDSVFADAAVLLTLSEAVCDRVALPRWALPSRSPRTKIEVPSTRSLEQLVHAVSFSPLELSNLLGNAVHHIPALAIPGTLDLDELDQSSTGDRIYLFPLFESADGSIVLALPSGVAVSITHRALARAVEENLQGPFKQALHEALQRTIHRLVSRLRWVRRALPDGLEAPKQVSDAMYWFDIDKVAHVSAVIDPLEGYTAGKPFAGANFLAIQDELHERFAAVRAAARAEHPQMSVLHLVCMASLGRSQVLGFMDEATDDDSALLVLTQDDLDIMTLVEQPEPLGLWRFALASDRLHRQTQVLSFSKLDEYAIYRDNRHGFYMSDDGKPDVVHIAPGSAGELRADQRQRADQHAVTLPHSDVVTDVLRWTVDDATPVYRPESPRWEHLHLVEIAAACWVVPLGQDEDEKERSRDLADVVAFWLWRCRDWLTNPLAELRRNHSSLVVDVRFVSQSITDAGVAAIEPTTDWLQCTGDPGGGKLSLTLLDGASSRLRGSGNAGERALAGELVAGIYRLAGFDEEDIAHRVSESLPTDHTKMFHVLNAEDDSLLTLGYAPKPRILADADIEPLLDEIGDFARTVLELTVGRIPHGDGSRVLNAIVGELFSRLKTALASLNPSGLLERLVIEQEGLIYLEARDRLLVPTQAACFGDDSSAVKRSLQTARDLTATSPASRFIIECVTAAPPSGTRPLSVGQYDSLLALAKQIIEYGFLSDVLRYELSSVELSMLASGRIGISRTDPYHVAVSAYSDLLSERALGDARGMFSRHWRYQDSEEQPFDPRDLNNAFSAEFGLSATELATISGEMISLAASEHTQTAVRPIDALIQHLGETIGYAHTKIRAGFDMLTLRPTADFPDSNNPVDNYPWRFSRNRSAARRPVLLREIDDGPPELIWGPRAVHRAGRYLLDQILSARLKTHSGPMRQYVTRTRQAANAEFKRSVAAFYRAQGPTEVRENVKRLGKLKFARSDGQEIGDIDVLVIDIPKKVLVAIEVKDFEFARTPFELSNEVRKLLIGPHSAVSHHEERLVFLRDHLAEIVSELSMPGQASDWQVQGQVVTSDDLIAMRFPAIEDVQTRMKIVSFPELAAQDPRTLVTRATVNVKGSRRGKRGQSKRRRRQSKRKRRGH